ncbi:MAG: hypothetical protein HY329_02550 [Chloroflexi bacterium]|nr:hypothetical protein [Chloroflexota bacterium]
MDSRAARAALVHDYLVHLRGGERVLEAIHACFPEAPVHVVVHYLAALPERYSNWDIRPFAHPSFSVCRRRRGAFGSTCRSTRSPSS